MTKRKKRWIWGCLAAFVFLSIIAGSQDEKDSSNTPAPSTTETSRSEPNPEPQPQPKPNLELLEANGATNRFSTEITGRIRNNRSREYSYAQATFDVFDSQEQRVGTAMANINGLKPREIWKFKAVYLGSDGARFRLDEITGF